MSSQHQPTGVHFQKVSPHTGQAEASGPEIIRDDCPGAGNSRENATGEGGGTTGTTAETNEDALIQQSSMAAMEDLIRSIVHQWKQPVNTISLIVQSMQLTFATHQLTKNELDQNVADIMNKLHQISESISEFPTFFSRDDTSGTIFINEAVSRALFFTGPSLRSRGICLELTEQCSITASGRQNEFMQAVIHLILNARDALLANKTELPRVAVNIFVHNGQGTVTIADNRHDIPQVSRNGSPPVPNSKTHLEDVSDHRLRMSELIVEKRMNGQLSVNDVSSGIEYRIELNTA